MSHPIKVCHVTSVHPWTDARVFHKECCSLVKQYDVTLIAPNCPDCESNEVKVRGVALPTSRLKRPLCLGRVYAKMVEVDADVYHFHDPELMPLGIRIKRRKGKKVIFDSHEDVPAMITTKPWIPTLLRRPIARLYAAVERRYLRRYDALVSVTPTIVNRLRSINAEVYQVTNYPLLSVDTNDQRQWLRKVVFAGAVVKPWGLHNACAALQGSGITIDVLGPASPAYLDQLRPHVNYLGKLPFAEVNGIIQQSSAALALLAYSPNAGGHEGTLGNTKIFEYMQAGVPIICTDFRLWKEIVATHQCGTCVPPDDLEAIATAVRFYIDHPDEARRQGDNGKKAVVTTYNWTTQEVVLLQMYQHLLAQ